MVYSMATKRRAVGIIRVSEQGDRPNDRLASPDTQRERIEAECKRQGFGLVAMHEGIDEKGSVSLRKREGLRIAVEAVEAGQADVIVAAYFDRLFRSIETQTEVLRRVEASGGKVLSVDVGAISHDSAAQWLNATQHGMMSEYFSRLTREKSADGQRLAVEKGRCPFPAIPGYQRGDDGVLALDPVEAPVVAEAFRMRAAGRTIREIKKAF